MQDLDVLAADPAAAPLRIAGHRVGRIGYGAALRVGGETGRPGRFPDPAAARGLLRRAVALGATLLDTADSYGPGLSEELIAEALHPYPPELLVATKGGVVREADGTRARLDGRPAQLRAACENSLRRLRLEAIGLYQLHWRDPAVPFADQLGALAELLAAGKVRAVGLCNLGLAELEAAEAVLPVAAVQCHLSLGYAGSDALLDRCAARGIPFIAHGPLAVLRGGAEPRAEALGRVARRLDATPAQVALAWVLHRAPNVVAIPGTLRPDHLEENFRAGTLALSARDLAELAAA
ncbi:aldo/keto reductase [Roseomonas sp. BN140053]|uniref:aldo/keto reductase n=1 Tax=Roseomonas sp. BN140053 TaxID=3391898 RepID=UPI0039EA1DF4